MDGSSADLGISANVRPAGGINKDDPLAYLTLEQYIHTYPGRLSAAPGRFEPGNRARQSAATTGPNGGQARAAGAIRV